LIFLKRWSFLALALTILVAAAAPLLFRNDPDSPVAPPFSKPLWLDRDSPPTLRLLLENGKTSTSLNWQGTAPRQFSLKGHVKFGTSPSRAGIYWQTPEETILLEDLSGYYDILVDLDARDITFKLNLGIPPFDSAMEKLVPSDGQYRIFIESDVPVLMSDLLLTLEGGRWGFLGTDQRGRDVSHLFIMGIRVSLLVGISATVIATFIGLSMGLLSGYAGGLIDSFIMRGVDVLLSIPILPILMALAGIWGKGLWQLVLILSLFSWMGTARTVRALTLTLRDACFIENLRALGSTTSYILLRHLLPETLPLLLANIALGVPGAILAEAGISFLGLSDPRVISWGRMLHEAHSFGAFSTGAWWLLLPPGLGIAFLCLIFLDIGKYLEEKVDPRLKGEKAN
jgi:peptide/nickel transport system permease protein